MKKNLLLLIIVLLFTSPVAAKTWKFFFYMDTSSDLSDMAFKNITDMMRGKPNENVEILIQLHAYGTSALRYRATSDSLQFVDEVILSGDSKQDFIVAAQWALSSNNADHTMVVFSGHGWGALDPCWNPNINGWQVAEISPASSGNSDIIACALQGTLNKTYVGLHQQHKGFIFNDQTHTYLTNNDMVEVLSHTSNTLLDGKKIDIVVFDTCMGSMLEVATCVAQASHYLIGVQSCALYDGFDYQELIGVLNKGNDPRQTAHEVVKTFDQYYAEHDTAGIYTCAALDLSYVEKINNTLNTFVAQLLQNTELVPLLQQARNASPRFCLWPMYTDLLAFCKLVEQQIISNNMASEAIISTLKKLYAVSEQFVLARCGGFTTTGNAHGFSIYLPFKQIDSSYYSSPFVQQSQWIDLLKIMC